MSNHTSGPWEASTDLVETAINSVNEGKHIAMVNYSQATISDEEHEANVRLIAAAPKLHSLLTAALQESDDYNAGHRVYDEWVADTRKILGALE